MTGRLLRFFSKLPLGYLVAVRHSGLGRLAYVQVPVPLLRVGRTCRPRAIREFEPRRPAI